MNILIKIACFLTGCFIILILAISSNSQWFDKVSSRLPSPYRYGDLFLFSNMPGYKIPLNRMKITTPDKANNIVSLTIIGDSYMREFDSTSFCANSYRYVHWDNTPDTIPLPDPKKTNVFIIETTERYCRQRLKNNNPVFLGEKKNKAPEPAEIKLSAEDNLQYIITNQDWLLPFKELKTSIYLELFNKFDGRVEKPDGKGRLYLEETINPQKTSSCYNPVSDNEINELVNSINLLYKNIRRLGFEKIYTAYPLRSSSFYNIFKRHRSRIYSLLN